MRSPNFQGELLGCFAHRVRLLPLRERKQDIPQLCDYLLEKFARDFGCPVPHLSSEALEVFLQWKWPGNVRELENWIARIVIFGVEEVVGLEFSRQLMAGGSPDCGTIALLIRVWVEPDVCGGGDEVTREGRRKWAGSGKLDEELPPESNESRASGVFEIDQEGLECNHRKIKALELYCPARAIAVTVGSARMVTVEVLRRP